jgi:hypothetical protein
VPAPAFLKPLADFGHYRVLEAPGEGYFGVVDVPAAATASRDNFYELSEPWLRSEWAAKDQYIWLDFHNEAPKDLPRVTPGYFPPVASAGTPGTVRNERQAEQVYQADLDVRRPAYVVFRMTYHPDWKVLLDGKAVRTFMVTPGFLAAAVPAGTHHIYCRYEPGSERTTLAFAGLGIVALLLAGEYWRERSAPKAVERVKNA